MSTGSYPSVWQRRRMVLAVAVTGVVLAAAGVARTSPGPGPLALMDKVNKERRSRGLQELTWNRTLAGLAQVHARDMLQADRLTHETPEDGTTYSGRLARTDLRVINAAENIALDSTVDGAHRGLMQSPGHRRNILDPELAEIGIGIARTQDGQRLYVVQDFATLMPRQTDKQALAALRDALHGAWEGTEVRLREDGKLSRQLRTAVKKMARTDTVEAGGISTRGPAWVFTYTTARPAQLPEGIRSQVGRTRRYGVALTFQRSPSAPFGLYWVALVLADPVKAGPTAP